MANVWAILHDADRYPEPYEFRPERFISKDGQVIVDPAISIAFGYGRR